MKVIICIGSACHVRGSKQVIETLTRLVREYQANVDIELSGCFCMGACSEGVSIKIGERIYHVKPEDTEDFFREVVLEEAKKCES